MVKNIEEFCKIEELDILIVDHAEPDHSTQFRDYWNETQTYKSMSATAEKLVFQDFFRWQLII
jgi:flavorubredoxin